MSADAPGALLPAPNTNPNAGLFQLVNNPEMIPQEVVSLCRIAAAVRVSSATCNNTITYLPKLRPRARGLRGRGFRPPSVPSSRWAPRVMDINAEEMTQAQGTVLQSQFGVLVLGSSQQQRSYSLFLPPAKVEISQVIAFIALFGGPGAVPPD